MSKIIKNNAIVDDAWQILRLEAEQKPENAVDELALPDEKTLLPLAFWLARRDEILARHAATKAPIGIWLDSDESPESIAGDLEHFVLIGLNFPMFTDGRAYSSARLLRERYQYLGEVRALGDVLQDQLFFMKRCGFNAYAVRTDKNIDAALASLKGFRESYQAAVDQPQPLFRRRLA